ncbi:hypothetical protein ACETU7_04360 [Rhodococcus sp. 3Y1]
MVNQPTVREVGARYGVLLPAVPFEVDEHVPLRCPRDRRQAVTAIARAASSPSFTEPPKC